MLCLLFPQLKIENCIIFSDTTCISLPNFAFFTFYLALPRERYTKIIKKMLLKRAKRQFNDVFAELFSVFSDHISSYI